MDYQEVQIIRAAINRLKLEVPVGTVIMFTGNNGPKGGGYLPCDGSEVSQVQYAELYEVLGSTFGPAAAGNFCLPNLVDKFPIGQGVKTLGSTGGSENITLVTSDLPAHSHTITDVSHSHMLTDSLHSHTVTDPGHLHAISGPGGRALGAGSGNLCGDWNGGSAQQTQSGTTGVTLEAAYSGVTMAAAFSGITATNSTPADDSGQTSVAITPPYTVLGFWIKY